MTRERNGRRTKVSQRPASASRAAGFPGKQARSRTALHLLILTAVSLALYADALRNDFVSDDTSQLVRNPLIRNYHNIPKLFSINGWSFLHANVSNFYRPVQMLFYMGEYYLAGLHPWAFHLGNLLVNTAAVLAAYFLVRALADEKLALWAALFFAFQPIHVEAVVWIAALPELLCALCYFTAMLFYHLARSGVHPARDHAIATAIFFAGLFSKETMLVFPTLLLAYEFFYRRESLASVCRGFQRLLPYLCALGIYIAIRLRVLGSFAPKSASFTHRQIFLTMPVLLCRYLFKLLWPVNMNYFYVFIPLSSPNWEFVASAALIGGLIGIMFWLRKSQPLPAFALAWFFVIIAPALSISNLGKNIFTERYLYIPSLGICILAGCAWLRVREWVTRKTAFALAYPALAVVLIFNTVLIVHRIPDWRSQVSLFQKTALHSPDSPDVQGALGFAYYAEGEYGPALSAFERLLALEPNSSDALYVAYALSALGDSQGANAELLLADKLEYTEDNNTWLIYGDTYTNLKEWGRAIECYRKEIEKYYPENPSLWTSLGEALQENGQAQESIAVFREAILVDPGRIDASINLAIALAQQGDLDQAISLLDTALRYHPDGPEAVLAWLNLGDVYANKAEWNEAAAAYLHALDLDPDMAIARDRLDHVQTHLAASRQ
jgi:protein O-mannosyl-transferase